MIKRHFTYTIKDISAILGTCEKTVQRWIGVEGLIPVEGSCNPYLIAGDTLSSFLAERAKKSKILLQPDEFFCMKCRAARRGKPGSVRVLRTETRMGKDLFSGRRTAECGTCGTQINRFFTYSKDDPNEIM